MENKPLLSLCIPTNGIMNLIVPVFESIYSDEVDESLYEVVVMDNGDNEEFHALSLKLEKEHTNFHYYHTDKKGFLNEFESYKKASGEFIKFVNHRTKVVPGAIEYLLDFARNNNVDKPAIYFSNGALGLNDIKTLNSFDQYVCALGLWNTWSTGMAFWKSDFDQLNLDSVNELFPHTNILFGIRNKNRFIVDDNTILDEIPVSQKNKGKYDLYYAFGVEFNNITSNLLEQKLISKKTFNKVRRDLFVFCYGLYALFNIKKEPCSYDVSNSRKSIGQYYSYSWFIICAFLYIAKKVFGKTIKYSPFKRKQNKYFIFDNPLRLSIKRLSNKLSKPKHDIYYFKKINNYHVDDKPKTHYLSICAIFKNEAPYLREWIEYHKLVGVNHFYMYNNNSEDNYLDILKPYIDNGDVTLLQWKRNQAQMECYNHCIYKYKNETSWLAFIDIDEFVLPREDVDLINYLKTIENKCPSLLVYWKFFGSNNIDDRDIKRPVIEDFDACWPKYANIGKCFYNTNYDYRYSRDHQFIHHDFWAYVCGTFIPPMNTSMNLSYWNIDKVRSGTHPIQINHYFTKSKSEYISKKTKGDVFFKTNPHDDAYFAYHDGKCTAKENDIKRYLPTLKKKLS